MDEAPSKSTYEKTQVVLMNPIYITGSDFELDELSFEYLPAIR